MLLRFSLFVCVVAVSVIGVYLFIFLHFILVSKTLRDLGDQCFEGVKLLPDSSLFVCWLLNVPATG